MTDFDTLPDGEKFPFWDDKTVYTMVYHVAQKNKKASDDNPGTEKEPFATIERAAEKLRPGEKVIVHAGIYRECVRPKQGGKGPDQMIAYEKAKGEEVVITGAEILTPLAKKSTGWNIPLPANGGTIWMTDLPEDIFHAYNPFLVRNTYEHMFEFAQLQNPPWIKRALLRRGMIFYNGQLLTQVLQAKDLKQDGMFWVEESGLCIHFRLPGDAKPDLPMEISVREQTFAPRERGLGYIRVSGFTLEHAAGPLPVTQRGSLSTERGHHWIIEDCRVVWSNGVGIDIGLQNWDSTFNGESGHHIIRRNNISHVGICGLTGAWGVVCSLIEDNIFEHIGYLNLERIYECGGIKFHWAHNTLIRRNVFRHLVHAGGIWLDVGNVNNRMTNNVFVDIETLIGAVYSEMNFERNLVDHNVIWDIRSPATDPASDDLGSGSGVGVRSDCNDLLEVNHNFIGKIEGYAIKFSLNQSGRDGGGRTGLCRANAAHRNVIVGAAHRIHLSRREENTSDQNLFDVRDDDRSFHIALPLPENFQRLDSWQKYFNLDKRSAQACITANFDAEKLILTWNVEGKLPSEFPVPGPLNEKEWEKSLKGSSGKQMFPII